MTALVFSVVLVGILANLPLIFMLLFIHSRDAVARMWGLAPNQFVFPSLFFPFAATATLVALRRLVSISSSNLPIPEWIRSVLRVWPAFVLLGISIAALVGFIVYFGSSLSFDKLQPIYANRALTCADAFKREMTAHGKSVNDLEQYRVETTKRAREVIEIGDPPVYESRYQVDKWLEQLDCSEYLQVVHDAKLQRQLGLLDGALYVLTGIQLLVIVTMAGLCVFGAILSGIIEQSLAAQGYRGEVVPVLSLLQLAVLFYAAFTLCYGQHRREVEWFTGTTSSTILQDIFVGAIAFFLLSWIGYMLPAGPFMLGDLARFLPAVLLGIGAASQFLHSGLLRRLIGSETNFGTQALLYLMVCVFGSVWLLILLQKK